MRSVVWLLLSALAAFPLLAQSRCAQDLDALRALFEDSQLPLVWVETTADDGKPLVVSISERLGELFLQFDKTREGLWAAGSADFCAEGDVIVATIGGQQMRLGEAAPWLLRMRMQGGASFRLHQPATARLRISTPGWRGEFVPR